MKNFDDRQSLQIQNRKKAEYNLWVSEQLGLKRGSTVPEQTLGKKGLKKFNDFSSQYAFTDLDEAAKNPLYQSAMGRLGIKKLDSFNDMKQIYDALYGGSTASSNDTNNNSSRKGGNDGSSAPSAAPSVDDTPAPSTAPGLPELTIPGVNVRLLGENIGIKARSSKARKAGLINKGTSRLTIPRSAGASSLNLG